MHSWTWLLLFVNLERTCCQYGATPRLAETSDDTEEDCAEQQHPIDTSFLQSHLQLDSSLTGGGGHNHTGPKVDPVEQIVREIDRIDHMRFIKVSGAEAKIMTMIFLCALILVATEDLTCINKSAVIMVTAAVLWLWMAVSYKPIKLATGGWGLNRELHAGLLDTASTVLFLLPAMGVVETIDHFDGFAPITYLVSSSRRNLMPIIFVMTFALSSVIDNLTSTIVAVKILHKLLPDDEELRKQCGALAVIASNAGGAWSPIGDLTTTMLWIEGKISVTPTVHWLLFPSVLSGVLPLVGFMWQARPSFDDRREQPWEVSGGLARTVVTHREAGALIMGLLCILMVPALKVGCGLPPYLGMLLALGLFWLLTDLLGFRGKESVDDDAKHHGPPRAGVVAALKKVELTGLLFITGVLLAVGALNTAGVLKNCARHLHTITGGSPVTLSILLGLSSAVVDNVPLVDACIDMYEAMPRDDALWQLLALSAGTGGSILSIGSMAGVLLMSMENVGFLWYCRNASVWAILGFFLGIGMYQIEVHVFG